MEIKGIIPEDWVNYKEPCFVIEFPYCDWKCERECGRKVCHNSSLRKTSNYNVPLESLVEIYMANTITKAICFQGLEPFDSPEWLELVDLFRQYTKDTIVIYTGYYENEIAEQLKQLKKYSNIIVKFGRFVPNQPSRYDELLGVSLASPNQYAKKIS